MKVVKLFALAAICCAVVLPAAAADVKLSALTGGAKAAKMTLNGNQRNTNGPFLFTVIPEELKGLTIVTVPRGNMGKPGTAFSVTVNQPATVYLLVHDRGTATVPADWKKTNMKIHWRVGGEKYTDTVYEKQVKSGKVDAPAHNGKDKAGSYGIPNALVIKPAK